jgi:hypothetical protein
MSYQQLIFTALPRGLDGHHLSLSVLISPRLTVDGGEGTLAVFPDLVSWPSVPITWTVEVTGQSLPATETGDLDPALWTATFPASTRVKSHRVEAHEDNTRIRSYPVAPVHDFIRDQYRDWASTATREPMSVRNLLGLDHVEHPGLPAGLVRIGPALIDINGRDSVVARIQELYGAHDVLSATGDFGTTELNFARADQFFDRSAAVDVGDVAPGSSAAALPAIDPPEHDFHEQLSLLGDHPQVLRRLGMIRDLTVELPSGVNGPVTLRALPAVQHTSDLAGDTSPLTNATLSSDRVTARPRADSVHAGGLLDLSNPDLSVPAFDADHAVTTIIAYATRLTRLATSAQQSIPGPGPIPVIGLDSDGTNTSDGSRP